MPMAVVHRLRQAGWPGWMRGKDARNPGAAVAEIRHVCRPAVRAAAQGHE